MARNTQAEQIADPERRLQRIERACELRGIVPYHDSPTGLSAERRAAIEAQAARVRDEAAKRPRAARYGDPIYPAGRTTAP
jgi:hypothetical protein